MRVVSKGWNAVIIVINEGTIILVSLARVFGSQRIRFNSTNLHSTHHVALILSILCLVDS